jgi:hypothetical protein
MAISLRKAINDKCKDCTYDEYSGLGNWRQQITLCTVKKCPLWPVRPKSTGKAVFERLEAEDESECEKVDIYGAPMPNSGRNEQVIA